MPENGNFSFEVLKRDPNSRARLGRLITPHGVIETPNFIFCATHGEVKTVSMDQVRGARAQIILSNTYHLLVKGRVAEIESAGGLQKWTGWNGPMLTDSGGYQIFAMGHGSVAEDISEIKRTRQQPSRSLEDGEISRSGQGNFRSLKDVTEDGALFESYVDGSKVFLTPEMSVDVQRRLGADLIVQLDELTSLKHDRDYTARSMELSMRWGDRSLAEFNRHADGRQAMYGVVQGGIYEDLRHASTQYVAEAGFFGTAVGGCLGRNAEQMYEVVSYCAPHINPAHPVHLLGIGKTFQDIFANIRSGIDTFDCVHPTRAARHGTALVRGYPDKGRVDLTKGAFKDDRRPLDESCPCPLCAGGVARAELRPYFKVEKPAGWEPRFNAAEMLTVHNMTTMTRLMAEIRDGIAGNTLAEVEQAWIPADSLHQPKSCRAPAV